MFFLIISLKFGTLFATSHSMRVSSLSAAPTSDLPHPAAPRDGAAGQSFQTVLHSSVSSLTPAKSGGKPETRYGSDRKAGKGSGDAASTYSTPAPLFHTNRNTVSVLPGTGVAISAPGGMAGSGDFPRYPPGKDQVAAVFSSASSADECGVSANVGGPLAAANLSASPGTGLAGLASLEAPDMDQGAPASPNLLTAEAVPSDAPLPSADANPALLVSTTAATKAVADMAPCLNPIQPLKPTAPPALAPGQSAAATEASSSSSSLRHGHAALKGFSLAAAEKSISTREKGLQTATDVTPTTADPTKLVATRQHAMADSTEPPNQPLHAETTTSLSVPTSDISLEENGNALSGDAANQPAPAAAVNVVTGTRTPKNAGSGTGSAGVAPSFSATSSAVLTPFPVGWEGSGAGPGVSQSQGHSGDNTSQAAPSPVPHEADAVLEPGVTTARLLQSFSRSEMQVKVNSAEFGRVTIHTAYGREAIAAQITLSNAQLGSALAAHVPAIEQKLGQDHGLRASVTIDTQTQAGAEQKQRQPDTAPARRFLHTASSVRDGTVDSMVTASATSRSSLSSTARLDIRI